MCFVAVVAGAHRADAAPAPVPARPQYSVVMVAARNQAAASKELHQAVVGQLGDAPVRLTLHWVDAFAPDLPSQLAVARGAARGKHSIAAFWCDLSSTPEIYLYLAEPGKGRLLVRSVASAEQGGRSEAVAIIVGSSVRAFIRGGQIQVQPPRARAEARRAAARSLRRPLAAAAEISRLAERTTVWTRRKVSRRSWLSLELGYAYDAYGAHHPALHGASIGLAARLATHWSVFASYRVMEPIKAKGEIAETSLQRHPLTLGARFQWQWDWFALGGGLGLLIDYTSKDTSVSEGFVVSNDRGDVIYYVAPEIRFGFSAVGRLTLLLAIGVEIGLNLRHYQVLMSNGDRDVSILPWPVQPYFRFGLVLDLF